MNTLLKSLFVTLLLSLSLGSVAKPPSPGEDWRLVAQNVKAVCFELGQSERVNIYKNTINGRLCVDVDDLFFPNVERSDRQGYAYMFTEIGMFTGGYKFYFNLPQKKSNPRTVVPRQTPQTTTKRAK